MKMKREKATIQKYYEKTCKHVATILSIRHILDVCRHNIKLLVCNDRMHKLFVSSHITNKVRQNS